MMAFDPAAVEGGVVGTITVSVMNAVRFGVLAAVFPMRPASAPPLFPPLRPLPMIRRARDMFP